MIAPALTRQTQGSLTGSRIWPPLTVASFLWMSHSDAHWLASQRGMCLHPGRALMGRRGEEKLLFAGLRN